uniref:LAGLIDADG homing endonuclease n=1 Tax=Phanerochaete carnosa TaxID=231932 RepID=A0A895KW54_9APHY|nr:LAGLIDADG homing endonuclease [Phanerochaete carnosa]QRZ60352.1 LAGLIDADG homing endonuclease [Phanerochaete carnosa]
MSGQNNYLGMVISYLMNESEMGYRGSKSEIYTQSPNQISVKEQRVDGSCFGISPKLRCILMGFERNYQINNPSNQFKKYFSTVHSVQNVQLNPFWITGFVDAEGSFTVVFDKSKKRTLGWRIQPRFQIGLHVRDLALLLKIQKFFGGIGIVNKSGNMAFYSVYDVKNLLQTIIPHFIKYPLLTQKGADFILFKKIVELMNNNVHLTIEGIHQIINIKAAMNLGLSELLRSEFKDFKPVERPLIQTETIPEPYWVTGFVDGEGTFDIKIYSSKTNVGFAVQLRFRIPQHERLIELLIKYFGSGSAEKHTKHPAVTLVINKFATVTDKIIPFFESYPLEGVKKNDYLDWCKVARLMSSKAHLTQEGLNLIRTIKSGMNTGRKK